MCKKYIVCLSEKMKTNLKNDEIYKICKKMFHKNEKNKQSNKSNKVSKNNKENKSSQNYNNFKKWLNNYDTSNSGPRKDQLKAYDWFKKQGWVKKWPLI